MNYIFNTYNNVCLITGMSDDTTIIKDNNNYYGYHDALVDNNFNLIHNSTYYKKDILLRDVYGSLIRKLVLLAHLYIR